MNRGVNFAAKFDPMRKEGNRKSSFARKEPQSAFLCVEGGGGGRWDSAMLRLRRLSYGAAISRSSSVTQQCASAPATAASCLRRRA